MKRQHEAYVENWRCRIVTAAIQVIQHRGWLFSSKRLAGPTAIKADLNEMDQDSTQYC